MNQYTATGTIFAFQIELEKLIAAAQTKEEAIKDLIRLQICETVEDAEKKYKEYKEREK